MKKKRYRRKKKQPYDTLDDLKVIIERGQQILWGHKLEWRVVKDLEATAVCMRCGAVVVIVVRPPGIDNVITGLAVNSRCSYR